MYFLGAAFPEKRVGSACGVGAGCGAGSMGKLQQGPATSLIHQSSGGITLEILLEKNPQRGEVQS